MTNFTMDKKEYDKWLKNLELARDHLDDEVFVNLLRDLASDIVMKARMKTPVDTGNLRASWAVGNIVRYGNDIGIEIYNNAYHNRPDLYGPDNTGYYASFIEYGFRFPTGAWYQGRFMLTMSLNEVKAVIPREFNKAFLAWVNKRKI